MLAVTIEAEGHRELNHHGVLRCLAGGEWCGGGALICTVMDGPIYQSHTACPAKELLSCELLAIQAALK
jgi:hypothetical protein